MRGKAVQHGQKVDEAEKVVLEPEDDLVVCHGRVESAVLLDQIVALAQQVVPIGVREEARPRLHVDIGRNRSGNQRFVKRKMLAGDAGATGQRRGDVTIVDVNHAGGLYAARTS